MAKARPHVDVIAVDVYRRGLARRSARLTKVGSDRISIRLILTTAVDVLQHDRPDSLCGVRVFDPWPKAPPARRLLQPTTMALDRRPLVVVYAATDHPGYAGAHHRGRRRRTALVQNATPKHRTAADFGQVGQLPSTEGKPSLGGRAIIELLWKRLSERDLKIR